MLKKAALLCIVLLIAAIASTLSLAAVSLNITSLSEGISPKTGQVYEIEELNRAHSFALRLDSSTAYTGSSVSVSLPEGVKLEYNAKTGAVDDWRALKDGDLILSSDSLSSGTTLSVPLRVTLLQSGDHAVGFRLYNSAQPDTPVSSLDTTWRAPMSKYTISFAEVPMSITGGTPFTFKAYIRNSESEIFDYSENALIRVTATPSGGIILGERDGQRIIEDGQSSGNMQFVLPSRNGVKTVDYTANIMQNGSYTLTFTLMEAGEGGRVITTSNLSVQVGSPAIGNPGTGRSEQNVSIINILLPILTLVLFSLLCWIYEKEANPV